MRKFKYCIILVMCMLCLVSVKTYALSPPSLTIENDKDVITSNNAILNVALTNSQTKLITKFELKLYQHNELDERELIATVDKTVNSKENKIQVVFNLYEDFSIELSPETKYSYYVSAFDENGGVSSGYSNGFWFTTPAVTHSVAGILGENETGNTNSGINFSYFKSNEELIQWIKNADDNDSCKNFLEYARTKNELLIIESNNHQYKLNSITINPKYEYLTYEFINGKKYIYIVVNLSDTIMKNMDNNAMTMEEAIDTYNDYLSFKYHSTLQYKKDGITIFNEQIPIYSIDGGYYVNSYGESKLIGTEALFEVKNFEVKIMLRVELTEEKWDNQYLDLFDFKLITLDEIETDDNTTTGNEEVSTNALKIKKAKIKKIYAKKKSAKKLKLSIKKVKRATGYQIAVYKAKKNAKNSKKFLVRKSTKKLTVTVKSKKLKNKKKLYVRVRAYAVTNNGEKVYGKWSKVKKVIIKK